MKRTTGRITSIWQSSAGTGCDINTDETLQVEPGQYIQCRSRDLSISLLAQSIFPITNHSGLMRVVFPAGINWDLGTELTLRGPLGNGFKFSGNARRVSLAALDTHPYRLASLAQQIVEAGLDINLYIDPSRTFFDIHDFPKEMEILPLEQLAGVDDWADFLAVDVPLASVSLLKELLPSSVKCPAQVLIHTPMPCGGLAECGVCELKTERGWIYLCKDGPVIDLQSLYQ